MSLHDVDRLSQAYQHLRQQWERTKAAWNDPVQRDFESTYWAELESLTSATQQAMERLAQTFAQAQRQIK